MSAQVLDLKGRLILGDGGGVPPDNVLNGAVGCLDEVIVIGLRPDGTIYMGASKGPTDVLWLMERAKSYLLNGCQE